MMPRLTVCCSLIITTFATAAFAVVDQSPMPVKVVAAFPQLDWPDWLRGLDVGKPRDPRPLLILGARDGTNRVFAGSQYGVVFVWANDGSAKSMKTFLDIRDRAQYDDHQNEEGFLGLAFHPRYKANGQFFVYYTAKPTPENPHLSIISRFHVSRDNPNRADPSSEEVIMRIKEPYWNHNGGTLIFGPDGYLYIGLGDGGLGNDPHGNGQKMTTLLGKILRIDVDHKDPGLQYAIPKDNPFAGRGQQARGEIWALGVRNIWRMSFDPATGVLWAGDVGQDAWEEIDIIRRGGNYGWNLREGLHPFGPMGSPPRAGLIEPIWEYSHSIGKSIIGGNVYRGKAVPELQGLYLYADYVTGQVWALRYDSKESRVVSNRTIQQKGAPILSFGQDDEGEVYFLTQQGAIQKFASP
ncbi:MAG TPA: PQQ-dependent sugar dehydrogenase [Lacipirellulaceae bacterium]|nr:PQQ-dependent sugar dehydrogenase [Lacipirellulaceae bacterium]